MANARQLFLDLLLRDKTGPGSRTSSKNLKDIGDAAEDAAKSTERLGDESDHAEDQVGKLGKSARTAAEHIEHLDREIESVERELKQLAVSFAEADAAADRLDLSKAIRRTESDLKKLNKSKGLVSQLLPSQSESDAAGKSFAKRLAGGIMAGVDGISTTLGGSVGPTIGGAIGLAAAPVLLSSLGSALAAGTGVGVLGVGIMAAVKGDKDIQGAGKEAGRQFTTGLQDAATKSLKGPILQSLGIVSAAGDRLNKDLGQTFDSLSGHLVPFTRKVVGAGEAITGSLLKSARNSGPAIDGLGDSVGLLGDGIAKFIGNVADGGPEAADNLRMIAGATADLVAWSGKLIGTLGKLSGYAELTGPFVAMLRDHYKEAADKAKEADDAQKNLTPSILSAGEAAGEAGQKMQTYADSMNDAATKGRGLYDSQTDVAQAVADAKKAIKENGTTLDINTQKGRDNREMLSGLAGKLTANYAAFVKLNGEGRAAQTVAQNNRTTFINLATALTGSRTKAEQLATELGLIPAKKDINFHANTHDAAARLAALNKKANDAARARTLSVHVSVSGTERLDALGHRIGGYRAAGGPVKAGKAYVVGEHRPEVFVPNQDGKIIPSIDKAMSGPMAARAAASSVGSDGTWVAVRGDELIDQITKLIASRVSAKGGRAAQLGIKVV